MAAHRFRRPDERSVLIFLFFLVLSSITITASYFQVRSTSFRPMHYLDPHYTFPETPPAHVDAEFSRWAIPDPIKQQLWDLCQASPVNPKTGRHWVMLTVVNVGMINFASNMFCSLLLANVSADHHFFVALDNVSYCAMLNLSARAVLFEEGNFTNAAVNIRRKVQFYDIVKVKPTFVHQLLLWNVEVIPTDADIVFLQNPLDLFSSSADFETQCDSYEHYRLPAGNQSAVWQVNLGYYKVQPSAVVLRLMPRWLRRMYMSPKDQDQAALWKMLKRTRMTWSGNDTIAVFVREILPPYKKLTFRFLDPMLITNAGGLWHEGKANWKKEAKRRRITRPVMVHFFHIAFIREKLGMIKEKNLWFVNDEGTCVDNQTEAARNWPLWKEPAPAKNARRARSARSGK